VTDFLDTIASEKQPAVSGNDMMHVLEILDAAYESDATGRRINI
jgi:predicted dehydrogenase